MDKANLTLIEERRKLRSQRAKIGYKIALINRKLDQQEANIAKNKAIDSLRIRK